MTIASPTTDRLVLSLEAEPFPKAGQSIVAGESGSDEAMGTTVPSEPVDPALTDWQTERLPIPWKRPLAAAGWLIQMTAGTAALTLLLAIVAAIPIANFYALGYLIDVSGRVARGRLRDGFWLWGVAPRLGTIFLALWATLVPIRFLAGFAEDAAIIDPTADATRFFRVLVVALAGLAAGHLLLAIARGGRVKHFLWPVGNLIWLFRGGLAGGWWTRATDELAHLIGWLQVGPLWWKGVRGFIGALAWLAVPATIYAGINRPETAGLLAVFIPLTMLVFCRLPFLQTRFAADDSLKAYAAPRDVRRLFGYAPWSWLLAVVLLYVLSLPLYLTKIVLPPADAAWLATTVFIVSIFPAKLMLGWAYGRAVRRREAGLNPAPWWSRWGSRLLMAAFVLTYIVIVFLMKYVCEHGRAALFETHAFLLPWPF